MSNQRVVTQDAITADDGTEFSLQSENTRGEGQYYWIMRRDPGASRRVTDGVFDGHMDKRVVMSRMRKRVTQHNVITRAKVTVF